MADKEAVALVNYLRSSLAPRPTGAQAFQEVVDRLSVEAGLLEFGIQINGRAGHVAWPEARARFAHLVAEECAKVCEEQWQIDGSHTAREFADAIRAKFGGN